MYYLSLNGFDGVDWKQMNVHCLRDQIGFVNIEPLLFNTTIAENIVYRCGGDLLQSQSPFLFTCKHMPIVNVKDKVVYLIMCFILYSIIYVF